MPCKSQSSDDKSIYKKRGKKGIVFEDGFQSRDFVYVEDAAMANILALTKGQGVYNIGTGERHTVLDIAQAIAEYTDFSDGYEVSNKYRKGDVRHIWADIAKAKDELGYAPSTDFPTALRSFLDWASSQGEGVDPEAGYREVEKYGLI